MKKAKLKHPLSLILLKIALLFYLFAFTVGSLHSDTIAHLSEYTEIKGSLKIGVWEETDRVLEEGEEDITEK